VPDDPWQEHIDFMYGHYGRRDPECVWCGHRVVVALQGFYGGGSWSTDTDDEGPASSPGDGRTCAASPDGTHDVISEATG
jgi:hypothetical protein